MAEADPHRIATLRASPYELLAELRREEPVAWIPELAAWLITRRDLAFEAMRDAETFTVDDPRFSTAAVLGRSMLSIDGPEHERHRSAFTNHFRPNVVRSKFEEQLGERARELVAGIEPLGRAELRSTIAGPLAVDSITQFLGLAGVDAADVLEWYDDISDAIVGAAVGDPISEAGRRATNEIHERVGATLGSDHPSLLADLRAEAILSSDELATETAVVMFGAIETSEGMIANLLWHLLSHPSVLNEVQADRNLVAAAIEESLRLEPAATSIDRYTTRGVEFGGALIAERDMVTISLLAANRDPEVFENPDVFDIHRANVRKHLTFVQGPHGCIGLHLARLETTAALNAVLDGLPNMTLDAEASSPPEGLIFRKPQAVTATW